MYFGLEHTQKQLASQFKKLCEQDEFPVASLFYGQECSSRMFAALSVARYYNVQSDSTVIISDRDYSYRIPAAIALCKKNRNDSSKKFLESTVGTYLKQFHNALIDSVAASSKKKFSDAADCMEILSQLNSLSENELLPHLEKLEKKLEGMNFSKSSVIAVSQIRAIKTWTATSSLDGKKKFVIIEGLENANQSVPNALLKIIEEPPLNTYFIIISNNTGRIPSTILSRVQKFCFTSFGVEEKNYILNSLFVNANQYPDINSFFVRYSGVNDNLLQESAQSLVLGNDVNLPVLVTELEKTQSWDRFFFLITQSIQQKFENDLISVKRAYSLINNIESTIYRANLLNQPKRLTFDYVIYYVQLYCKRKG